MKIFEAKKFVCVWLWCFVCREFCWRRFVHVRQKRRRQWRWLFALFVREVIRATIIWSNGWNFCCGKWNTQSDPVHYCARWRRLFYRCRPSFLLPISPLSMLYFSWNLFISAMPRAIYFGIFIFTFLLSAFNFVIICRFLRRAYEQRNLRWSFDASWCRLKSGL